MDYCVCGKDLINEEEPVILVLYNLENHYKSIQPFIDVNDAEREIFFDLKLNDNNLLRFFLLYRQMLKISQQIIVNKYADF